MIDYSPPGPTYHLVPERQYREWQEGKMGLLELIYGPWKYHPDNPDSVENILKKVNENLLKRMMNGEYKI